VSKEHQKREVALSACLLGCACRYDAKDNHNHQLLSLLERFTIVPFCPEDYAFGTPRPTMDLILSHSSLRAVSNEHHQDISEPIFSYAQNFFSEHPDIKLFIGKDRSPSCAVHSGKVYNKEKTLLHKEGTGLMAQVALDLKIESWDAEEYLLNHTF
jgi:uncharacterized protein YbbK (DUF523 family)